MMYEHIFFYLWRCDRSPVRNQENKTHDPHVFLSLHQYWLGIIFFRWHPEYFTRVSYDKYIMLETKPTDLLNPMKGMSLFLYWPSSGVARAFPGRQCAHPDCQRRLKWRKFEKNYEMWGKWNSCPHGVWKSGYTQTGLLPFHTLNTVLTNRKLYTTYDIFRNFSILYSFTLTKLT